jgi:restriction system protein
MAEVTKKRRGEMNREIIKILSEHPDGLSARDVINLVRKALPPTEYEAGEYPAAPGVQRYSRIVRFATIGTAKAGWIIKNRGTWMVTEEGKKALKDFPEPVALSDEIGRLYQEWKRTRPDEYLASQEDATDDEQSDPIITFEEAEETARQEIRDFLHKIPPYEFQDIVADLLRAMSYYVSWVAPPGKDDGVDIIASTDPLGTQGPRIKVQVKRQVAKISGPDLRSFLGTLRNFDVGIFVSLGGFTSDAHKEANQNTKRITIIDADEFIDLWIQNLDGISEKSKSTFPLRPIYFLAVE